MVDEFEWDDAKATSNQRKHGVSFDVVRELSWIGADARTMIVATTANCGCV